MHGRDLDKGFEGRLRWALMQMIPRKSTIGYLQKSVVNFSFNHSIIDRTKSCYLFEGLCL